MRRDIRDGRTGVDIGGSVEMDPKSYFKWRSVITKPKVSNRQGCRRL